MPPDLTIRLDALTVFHYSHPCIGLATFSRVTLLAGQARQDHGSQKGPSTSVWNQGNGVL
jgi:hypothetical protein